MTDHPSIDTLDDQALLALVGSHDPSALQLLYARYARLLYAIALRITHDSAAAEDVLQDVFANVWQRAQTFRPAAGSVATWLAGIARNRAIDEVRSRWYRARSRDLPLDQLPALQAAEHGLEDLAVLRSDVRHALATLPWRQRQAIELAYVGGFTGSEIAQQLNVPLGTIKGRMRLGLAKLRAALQPRSDLPRTAPPRRGSDAPSRGHRT